MSLLLALIGLQAAPADLSLQQYRAHTRATIPCQTTVDSDEVVICAGREADKRYRVPFVTARAIDDVPRRTERALDDGMFQCGVTGPFFAKCGGMVGFTMGMATDGTITRKRTPAP